MAAPLLHKRWSEEEYLAAEEHAAGKNEYVAGEVFATAGGSERHNRVCLNEDTGLR